MPPRGQVWMVLAWPRPPRERRITKVRCDDAVPPLGQMWMVLAWPLDTLGERRITKVCCDDAVPPLGQVWMVFARPWPRSPREQENHDSMLRWRGASPRPGVDGFGLAPTR